MKKTAIILIAVLLIAAAGWMLVSGFSVNSGVYVQDFSVSEDGSELTLTIGIGSSMGFVRGYTDEGSNTAHALKFYSAWGGLNSALGAKSQYVLKLRPEATEVYLYHGERGYELALQKDAETGLWCAGS